MPRNPAITPDGEILLPRTPVKLSGYLSGPATAAMCARLGMPLDRGGAFDVAAMRQALDQYYFAPLLAGAELRYSVVHEHAEIAGVSVEFTHSVRAAPTDRLLINLHGGGFLVGSGLGARLEATPLAAVTGAPVLSIDYRQAPEHRFPAASEDVARVYQALLEQYAPGKIGLIGVSAGALLASMSLAWFDQHGLPKPAATAMLFGGADLLWGGDSMQIAPLLCGLEPPFDEMATAAMALYGAEADPTSPLASPVRWPDLLGRFPPMLLASGGRAEDLSSVLNNRSRIAVYLGFRLNVEPPGFDRLVLEELGQRGQLVGYRRYAEDSHVAVFDLTERPAGGRLDPITSSTLDAQVPLLSGCVGIKEAGRW